MATAKTIPEFWKDENGKSSAYNLLADLPKGTTIYTVLRKVSRSGMSRVIDVCIIRNNEPHWIRLPEINGILSHKVFATDLDQSRAWGGDYKVHGCGMDMGFDLVYKIGRLIHEDGYWFNHRWI